MASPNIAIGRQSRNGVWRLEFLKILDVEKRAGPQSAGLEQHHEICATGQRPKVFD
jgi:hypothetical protein